MGKPMGSALLASVAKRVSGFKGRRLVRTSARLVPSLPATLALKSKEGVTAIEYGLIAALIAVAIIVAVTLVGTNLQLTFNMIAGHLGNSPH